MTRFLFDTSAFIDYLNHNDPDAIAYIEAVIDGSETGCCSVITEAELWAGIRNEREDLRVTTLVSKFEGISLTSSMARLAGNLLSSRSEGEKRAHFGDALIAATALEHGEIIFTADRISERVFGHRATYLVYR
jgi:predicted nucleic acid-binding protein